MDRLILIAILVFVLWVVLTSIYLYLGRQYKAMEQEFEAVDRLLQGGKRSDTKRD